MQRSIRHEDGSLITKSEWTSIQSSARLVMADLLKFKLPQNSGNRQTKPEAKNRKFFRQNYPLDWHDALIRLEKQQPLLALCAPNWKADHVLGNMLTNKLRNRNRAESDDSDLESKSDSDSDDITGDSGGNRISNSTSDIIMGDENSNGGGGGGKRDNNKSTSGKKRRRLSSPPVKKRQKRAEKSGEGVEAASRQDSSKVASVSGLSTAGFLTNSALPGSVGLRSEVSGGTINVGFIDVDPSGENHPHLHYPID
jgi:hypothetical protein